MVCTVRPIRKGRKVAAKPKGFWWDPTNRRRFLTEIADEMGFDPLNPDGWANITNAHIYRKHVRLPPPPKHAEVHFLHSCCSFMNFKT